MFCEYGIVPDSTGTVILFILAIYEVRYSCLNIKIYTSNGNSVCVDSGTENCSIVRYKNLSKEKNLFFNLLLFFTIFRVSVNSELCNMISYHTVIILINIQKKHPFFTLSNVIICIHIISYAECFYYIINIVKLRKQVLFMKSEFL